jgi:four helix bundle protein
MIRDYQDLLVWQRGMDLLVACYGLSDAFPRHELFGLTAQLRRAAVSVPANIAEGHGRDHLGDYLRHLSIANASLMEVETHLQAAGRLGYVAASDVDAMLASTAELGRMLHGLRRSLRRRAGRLHPHAPDPRHLTPDP